jgi:hypothetical protein
MVTFLKTRNTLKVNGGTVSGRAASSIWLRIHLLIFKGRALSFTSCSGGAFIDGNRFWYSSVQRHIQDSNIRAKAFSLLSVHRSIQLNGVFRFLFISE